MPEGKESLDLRYLAAYANEDPRLAFLSFPWIVWELLGRLKRQAFLSRHAESKRQDD